MDPSSTKKKRRRHIKGAIARQDLPVLNPRDLIDPIAETILELDPHAEFVLMVTDPRDHRSMSIRTIIHEQTKGTFLRTLIEGLWPADEDVAPVTKGMRAIETPEETKEIRE